MFFQIYQWSYAGLVAQPQPASLSLRSSAVAASRVFPVALSETTVAQRQRSFQRSQAWAPASPSEAFIAQRRCSCSAPLKFLQHRPAPPWSLSDRATAFQEKSALTARLSAASSAQRRRYCMSEICNVLFSALCSIFYFILFYFISSITIITNYYKYGYTVYKKLVSQR